MRICSFLPSATEIVYGLGLQDQLYGVTHECDYPPGAKDKPHVVRSVFDEGEPPSSVMRQVSWAKRGANPAKRAWLSFSE